jgi:hypothetical protein
MSDNWLEIADRSIDTDAVVRRVQERLAERSRGEQDGEAVQTAALVDNTWSEMIGGPDARREEDGDLLISPDECDIVPRHYTIGWRTPIIGPIHALVRRIIYAEMRRFVGPALDQQSAVNRQLLDAVGNLAHQNARLREEIRSLREQTMRP